MKKRVLVPVADGSEEIEAVCVIDILRRAGCEVTVASVAGLLVTMSRNVVLRADCLIADCVREVWDLIVLPGGMPGAEHLRDADDLTALLKAQDAGGRLFAAICASPAVVLDYHGLLRGRRATGYPGFPFRQGVSSEEDVVVDGNCVTSRGPGTAMAFALRLTALLAGGEKAGEVARGMLVR